MGALTGTLGQFRYTLVRPGWAQIDLRTRSQHGWRGPRVEVSARSDALGDLVRAVIALFQGAEHRQCVWYGSSDSRDIVQLHRAGDVLRLEVRFYHRPYKRTTTENLDRGPDIFQATLLHFAKQVRHQLKVLLDTWGTEGYRAMWLAHRFPFEEYQILSQLIDERTDQTASGTSRSP